MLKLSTLAALLVLPFAAQANNLIVNGSFESQLINKGHWSVLSTLSGWQVDQTSGVELRNNIAGRAQDGVNFAELDTHHVKPFDKSTNSAIWQTVTTQANALYTLSWWYSPRIGTAANTNDISVYWNDTLLMTNSGAGGSAHDWQSFSVQALGTGLDVVKFVAGGKQDTYGGSLDNVSLVAAPVPEAGTLSMVLAGLVAIGLMMSRQRRD